MKCTCEVVVNGGGRLIRAIATHIDVSDAVAARQAVENAEAEAVQDRSILRDVNAALATTENGLGELAESISIPTPGIKSEHSEPVLTRDQQTVEFGVLAHRDEQRRLADYSVVRAAHTIAVSADTVVADTGSADWLVDPHNLGQQTSDARHHIVAPVRHDGTVLGLLSIFRSPDSPVAPGDQHPVQLLADRVGSALGERLQREVRFREQVERRAVADRLLSSPMSSVNSWSNWPAPRHGNERCWPKPSTTTRCN